jgi:hypothetical protein
MQQILALVIQSELGVKADIVNGSTDRRGADVGSLGSQQARRTRDAMLSQFRDKLGFDVIILSPFVASIGLTITEANHVIHYGRWWNPAVEAQATDRVYRIGQTKPVHVYIPMLRDPKSRLSKSFDQNLHELIVDKLTQAQDFLRPLPEESVIGDELLGRLKGEVPQQSTIEPISAETIDKLPHHLFEALTALVLERQGYQTILTSRSNDHGADALAFKSGELMLVQAKHTKREGLVSSIAIGDLLAAAQAYARPLSISLQLIAITNGTFTQETKQLAIRDGIRLVDRQRLMAQIRSDQITLGAVYARESDRCSSFDEGIKAARRWFS